MNDTGEASQFSRSGKRPIFLPFVDNDPKTAEIVPKVILLKRDEQIKDPTILDKSYSYIFHPRSLNLFCEQAPVKLEHLLPFKRFLHQDDLLQNGDIELMVSAVLQGRLLKLRMHLPKFLAINSRLLHA